jgi:hypothetical protein
MVLMLSLLALIPLEAERIIVVVVVVVVVVVIFLEIVSPMTKHCRI